MKQLMILMAMFFLGNGVMAQRPDAPPHHDREHFDQKERRSPGERMQSMIQRLDEKINLSASQKTKVKAIFEDAHAKIKNLETQNKPQMEAMRKDIQSAKQTLNGDREAFRTEMQTIKEKYKESLGKMRQDIHRIKAESKAKISEVLTTEQRTEFFMMEENKKRRGGRRP